MRMLGVDTALERANGTLDAVTHLAPETGIARCRALLLATQPVHETVAPPRVDEAVQQGADGCADQCAERRPVRDASDDDAGKRTDDHRQHAGQESRNEPAHAFSVARSLSSTRPAVAGSGDSPRRAPSR